jgi:ABC-type transport system involved in cytochrome bd biosynthesis fused ATPase/permease subunit
MNSGAEDFRKATMKVLKLQLGSAMVMDIVAFGGTAAGIIIAAGQYAGGGISMAACLAVIFLAADFLKPVRLLGSYFHIAVSGVTAADRIFALLDMPAGKRGNEEIPLDVMRCGGRICAEDLTFSYEDFTIKEISFTIPACGLTAVVGESGSGKSTLAAILSGELMGYEGSLHIRTDSREYEIARLSENALTRLVTLVAAGSHIFAATVRENLLMAKPGASDGELWDALRTARLDREIEERGGLGFVISEGAANLSGGQKQRLALARALLHDTPVYIFDEATSNIDADSEICIMDAIYELAAEKTVIVISHRLANVSRAARIYVMERGGIAEEGSHDELIAAGGIYAKMYAAQREKENILS